MNKNVVKIVGIVAVVVLAAIIIYVSLNPKQQATVSDINYNNSSASQSQSNDQANLPPADGPTLTLSPASKEVAVGQTFTIDIILDTKKVKVDGSDVLGLHFNRDVLAVVDADNSASGTQIKPGTLMANTVFNSSNNETGLISFSQVPAGGKSYSGSGKLATITFKALSAGISNFKFDFVLGKTNDTNVAANGLDMLSSVSTATVLVK